MSSSSIELADMPDIMLGDVSFSPARRELRKGDVHRAMEPRVAKVLAAMASAPGTVLSRDRLIELCWDGRVVGDDALNRCVVALRRLAREFDPRPFEIETVPRIGYALNVGGSPVHAAQPPAQGRSWILVAAIAALIAIAIAAVIAARAPFSRAMTVAITADDARLASAFVARLDSAQPGVEGQIRLIDGGQRAAKADLELRLAVAGGQSTLVLKRGDGGVVWSRIFNVPVIDRNLMAVASTTNVLACALAARESPRPLPEPIFRMFLSSCDQLSEPDWDIRATVAQLRRVVESAPFFAGGWAKLLTAETNAGAVLEGADRRAIVEALSRDVAVARRLNLNLPEASIAEYHLLPETDRAARRRVVESALAEHPAHADLRMLRASFLQSVGRLEDAVADAREASRLNPISPSIRDGHIVILASAGQIQAAYRLLKEAEELWPGSASVAEARYRFHLRWGDPRIALQMLNDDRIATRGAPFHRPLLLARIDPTPSTIEAALNASRPQSGAPGPSIFVHVQALAEFGRMEELLRAVAEWRPVNPSEDFSDILFRPAFHAVHRDPRFMDIAAKLRLTQYWRETGEWPDFCRRAPRPYDCAAAAAVAEARLGASGPPSG